MSNTVNKAMTDICDPHNTESIKRAFGRVEEIISDFYQNPQPLRTHQDKSEFNDLLQEHPPQQGLGFEGAVDYFEKAMMPGVVKTWHPGFFNQMSAGTPLPAVLGETLSAMINSTLSTFEASPAGTVMEHMVSRWAARILGMPAGSAGIFLPGGSLSNLFALVVARETRGGDGDNVIFCSEAAHYSISNAIKIIGMGKNGLVPVVTNIRGEMDPVDLERKVEACRRKGRRPIAVVATCGLTVTGGFDPLSEIVPIAEKHEMHIHVDAAFGGGMAFTSRGSSLLAGIDKAHTVTWDTHKWMYCPLASSILLVPDKSLLKRVFASGASYLFHLQTEDPYIDDQGQYTPLCGKQLHALPFWFLIQTYGLEAFTAWSEERMLLTQSFGQKLAGDPDFELLHDPISPVICFRHVGRKDLGEKTLDRWQDELREGMLSQGKVFFNITTWKGNRYFRMILINPLTTMEYLDQMLADLKDLARQLSHSGLLEQ